MRQSEEIKQRKKSKETEKTKEPERIVEKEKEQGTHGKRKIRGAIIVIFWVLVWYFLALAVNNPILLATPQEVLHTLFGLIMQVSFWQTALGSFLRIGAGFLLGFVTALLFAGISLRCPTVEELLQPPVGLMKTVPVASFAVLLLIWWGSSVLAVAICFLIVFPNIYINTLEGLKNADERLLEMARIFRMSAGNRFFYIYRPALRPFLESSLKLSLGMCWKSGVAAEVIGTPRHSIGGQLYLSKIYLDTSGILAWTAIVILLSLFFERVILCLFKKSFDWNPSLGRSVRKRADGRRSKETGAPEGGDVVGTERQKSIIVKQVCKVYGEKRVLTDVSATYEPGKVYCLTSPSGSGKTTLLRLIGGLEHADSGSIDGVCRYSMMFQEDRLCEDYSALQNVSMVLGNEDGAEEALRKLLDEESITKPCGQLSGGMKRRVALVRAMEAESDAVLLDEPFTGMDADTRAAAENYIKERQNGRILVIASHIL